MTEAPEPEDKLDAATHVVVNGPEDAPFDWHAVDWRRVEDDKARLADRVHQQAEPFKALPIRRVYIPKQGSSTKRRPLANGPGEQARHRHRRWQQHRPALARRFAADGARIVIADLNTEATTSVAAEIGRLDC